MKILIIIRGFFPGKKYGGPPVSVDNFCSLLKDDAECYIVTHNHDLGDNEVYADIHEGWNDRGNAKVMYLEDKDFCYSKFKTIAQELRPDYLYLHGVFPSSILPSLFMAKQLNLRVVLAPRGELCEGAINKKKYKKLPYLFAIKMFGLAKGVLFQSTSDEETDGILKYLGVSKKNIRQLTNIPSLPHRLSDVQEKKIGEAHLVFISRILWKKNLLTAIKYLKNIEGNVLFDIYGPKEDAAYWEQCVNEINSLPDNVKVSYKGVLSHDKIHETFSKYDAFLFPTLSENYGHVIVESLTSGCIPIISDQTPWTDMNEAGAGWALPLNDRALFEKAVQGVVDMDNGIFTQMKDNIKKYLSDKLQLDCIKSDYLKVFRPV